MHTHPYARISTHYFVHTHVHAFTVTLSVYFLKQSGVTQIHTYMYKYNKDALFCSVRRTPVYAYTYACHTVSHTIYTLPEILRYCNWYSH